MPKFVTLVVSMLETCFWCLSPGFWVWEIHWDRFQTPQIDLSGQNGHFWPIRPVNMAKLVTFVLIMLETCF